MENITTTMHNCFAGDKGELCDNSDVKKKIETLDRENNVLSQKLSTLEKAFDNSITKINETR